MNIVDRLFIKLYEWSVSKRGRRVMLTIILLTIAWHVVR